MLITMPLPPSLNNAFATVTIKGKSRRIISREYKAWKLAATGIVIDQWQAQGQPKFSKPFALHYRFNIDHKSDIGNREKCATDLLVAVIPGFPGDQWCDRITIDRDRTIDGAVVEVVSL